MEEPQTGADRAFKNNLAQPLGLSVKTMKLRKGRVPAWHSTDNQQQSWPFKSLDQCHCYIHVCSSCLIIWQIFHFSIPRSSIISYSSTENATCSAHTNWSLICLHCTFSIHCSLVNPRSVTRPQKTRIISAQSSLFMCLTCPLSIIHLPLGSSTAKDSEKVNLWLRSH